MPAQRTNPATSGRRNRSRGQILVIFAGASILFMALCAVVVDVSYFWVGQLQAQRAADAAALAGAVYLPGDPTTAYAEARASAARNGYPSGVTPIQDSIAAAGGDPRQLDVTIASSVPTFFARVVGISSWPVVRNSKGVYVLPVPMGSPLAYYGVGDFAANQTTTVTTPYGPQSSVPGYTSTTPTTWATPNNAWTSAAAYTTSVTNNQAQAWQSLNIPAVTGTTAIDGITVAFKANVNSTGLTPCQVNADLSWNNGVSWTNASPVITSGSLTTTMTARTLGSTTSTAGWGNSHPSWTPGDFTNANFRVRLTYIKGSCGTVSLNSLVVSVYSHTTTSTTNMVTTYGVNDGATFLASQGGWGAIISKGGQEQNGDAYAPANNAGYSPTNNAKYDPNGYDYVISLPAGGSIKVYDPGFCSMGGNGSGGSMGAGDHWIGGSTGTSAPVSTYYTVWNSNGKPGLSSSWTQLYTSGSLFENQTGYDPANQAPGGGGTPPANATSGCDAYHNAWWPVPTGGLAGGTYILQVQTTKTKPPNGTADANINNGTNAENMWSIEAAGGSAAVYGNGRMTVYNNLLVNPPSGGQQFYLAKIDQATGAGKTAMIDLFDPGDVSGDATLKVYMPYNIGANTPTQNLATFSYTTDANCVVNKSDACSGTSRTQIQTAVSGNGSSFNNTWIHISVPLAGNYGQTGLWQGGWWQIRYEVPNGGNDTTTWQVSVSGNPVHLLVP